MITGTIKNAVKLNTLTQKWEQKKSSGNVLSKQERNERAEWTPEQSMLNQFKDELAHNREAGKNTEIANKIMSGDTLTPEEEQYLAQQDPAKLSEYRKMKAEKKAYENKLKNCKTKDEVQKLKVITVNGYLSELKKVENNPYIPLNIKCEKAQEILAKTRNIQAAEEKFVESGRYAKLPTEAEEATENIKEVTEKHEELLKQTEESVKPEDREEKAKKQEEISEEKEEFGADELPKKKHKARKDSLNPVKEIEALCYKYVKAEVKQDNHAPAVKQDGSSSIKVNLTV